MFQFFQGLDQYLPTAYSEYSQGLIQSSVDLPDLERRERSLEAQRRSTFLTLLY